MQYQAATAAASSSWRQRLGLRAALAFALALAALPACAAEATPQARPAAGATASQPRPAPSATASDAASAPPGVPAVADDDWESLASLGRDPTTKKLVASLRESRDPNERLVRRRQLRLTLLPPPPAPPAVSAPAFNEIDRFIIAKWQAAGLDAFQHPPPVCDDATFLRRIYLDLIGTIPTRAEAEQFQADHAPDKRTRAVDRALARNEEYAGHWTPFWEDALASATADLQGGIPTHGYYRDWIYQSFVHNKPYDQMVAELIDPAMPGGKKAGEANANGKISTIAFVRNDTPADAIQSAANVAQVFLGTGMKCASCHNHFLNHEWPQTRFVAFAGLFAGRDLELTRCEKPSGRIIGAQFPFELPGAPTDVPTGTAERLHRLAQLLIDPTNPRFAKTIVNRLWRRYLGLGLFDPVDDFRLDRPAANPELLAWLADDFMRHGYDLKRTIRLIVTSRTYQLRYDPALADHFDVAKADEPRFYRSPTLRRLTAEQVNDSVRQAAGEKLTPITRTYFHKTSTALTRALGKPASRNEISTARPDDAAVVQALELLNGEEFHKMIYRGQWLDPAAPKASLAQAVSAAYWTALSRPPTAAEQRRGEAFLLTSLKPVANAGARRLDDDPESATSVADLYWALFASPEFQYIR